MRLERRWILEEISQALIDQRDGDGPQGTDSAAAAALKQDVTEGLLGTRQVVNGLAFLAFRRLARFALLFRAASRHARKYTVFTYRCQALPRRITSGRQSNLSSRPAGPREA